MKHLKLFEDHSNPDKLKRLRKLGLAPKANVYDLRFSIDHDWAMDNGPIETEEEITKLINGVEGIDGIGKISQIAVRGEFGSRGIAWTGPLGNVSDNDDADEYDEDELDTYEFDSDAFITFKSYKSEAEIEKFIVDDLIHITAYGEYDLDLLGETDEY